MRFETAAAAIFAASLSCAATAGVVDPFTDQAAWEAALGNTGIVADDFSAYGEVDLNLGVNTGFNGYDIQLEGTDNGDAGINSATNLTFTLDENGLSKLSFVFDQDLNGFGGIWLNSFVSNGLTVENGIASFDVESFVPAPSFEFFGFTSSVPFNTVTITLTEPIQSTEFAALSDILYQNVPTPGAASLVALAGLAATRRRRA
ncbi:MAG: hypothetical protein AAGD00_03195 [Planctomycetota bacterium]